MFNRIALLAAAAVVAAVALAPVDASARGFGGGGGGGMRAGGGHGGGHISGLRSGGMRHASHGMRHHGRHHGRHHNHRHHRHHIRWLGWRAPVLVGTTGIATYAATVPSAGYCNCLTKEYLPDNTVVFKDLCTKEMAANPPLGPDQASLPPVK